jgi:hypothetical protein
MEPWDKVGIEFEYTDINPHNQYDFISFLKENKFVITHDASVESPSILYSGNPIKGTTLSLNINAALFKRGTIGGEIVTPILFTDNLNWVGLFDRLFGYIKHYGERPRTNRGSIHIHVSFPLKGSNDDVININPILKAWMLAGYLEAFFYRIGCMGRMHRGDNFDFIYCRPITENGPPIVTSDARVSYPLLVYDDVLKSENLNEFMIRCGDIRRAESKYHPSRYLWINFYNLYRYGNKGPHLEFRVFNKTMRIDYLYAIVELCKAFVKVSQKAKINALRTKINQIVSIANPPKTTEDVEEYFSNVVELLDLNEQVTKILKRIWDASTFPFFDNSPIYSHLLNRAYCYWAIEDKEYFPKKLSLNDLKYIRHPDYIDSHKLEQEDITIFPEEQKCAN